MITIQARYTQNGKKLSDKDIKNIKIKNENVLGIIDSLNFRLFGENTND